MHVQSGQHGIHIVCAVLALVNTHSVYNAGAVKTHIRNFIEILENAFLIEQNPTRGTERCIKEHTLAVENDKPC